MKHKTILVTGGAGFIGSHIADAYIKNGYRVVIIDNLSIGSRKNVNPKAKFYRADIRDTKAIKKVFLKERPLIVNHHASLVEIAKSIVDPQQTMDIGVIGTINLLNALSHDAKKGCRFIFASSGGALYGDAKKIPTNENAPQLPLSPYGLAKMMAEKAVAFYARMYGFDYVILRYANVYGPRQSGRGEAAVVPTFTAQMKRGAQPVIFGDGSKTRDYVYVDDIVRANVAALKKGSGHALNVGWGKRITDQQMYNAIARELNFSRKARYAPLRNGEIFHSALDASLAKKVLGWQPKTKFPDGIRKTLQRS